MNILEGDKPIVSIGLETRRVISKGENAGKSHIKIWVTFIVRENGEKKWLRRPYKTGLFCTDDEFERIKEAEKSNRRLPTDLHDIAAKLDEYKVKARSIINAGFVDEKAFESRFLSTFVLEDIAPEYEMKIAELRAAKPRPKISSAENYETSLKSLQEFFGNGVMITFQMLTPEKLQEYEDWYISQDAIRPKKKDSGLNVRKKSLTSVGFNLRCLRHIFKRAIKRGIIPATLYPFGIGLYVIPEGGDDTKQFLDTDEKNAFVTWTHADDRMNELHDYALFSYYGFGMNISDIARLTRDRVFKEYITIDRQKTKGRKKKKKVTVIPLHPQMKEIIKRRGKKTIGIPDDFVFPILEYKMSEEDIFYRIRNLVDETNDMLALMAKELKFETKPTTYTLRHTFAFNFMQQGATTEELQDALAHGSKQTTEAYKHGFALDKKKKFSEGL